MRHPHMPSCKQTPSVLQCVQGRWTETTNLDEYGLDLAGGSEEDAFPHGEKDIDE